MTKELIKELRKDSDFYYAWQANIAMAFYDEYSKVFPKDKDNLMTIHELANEAAKNFLNMLIFVGTEKE